MALCCGHLDYSESSQIAVVLTRGSGCLRVIAKGIKRSTRKRFAVGMDLLEVGYVVWSARPDRMNKLATLTEWKQQLSFAGLRERLDRLYAAQYAAEITSELVPEGEACPRFFAAMESFLRCAENSNEVLPLLCQLQKQLLIEIGLFPQLEVCLSCHGSVEGSHSGEWYFSSHQGGAYCRDCEMTQIEKRLVDRTVLMSLNSSSDLVHADAPALFDLLNYHLAHLMGSRAEACRLCSSCSAGSLTVFA